MKTVLIIGIAAALAFAAFGLSLIGCGDDEQTYTGHAVVGYVTDADTAKPLPSRKVNFNCRGTSGRPHWGAGEFLGITKTNAEGDYVFPDPAYAYPDILDIVLSHLGHSVHIECESGGGYKNQRKVIDGFGKASLPERVDFQLDPIPTE
jgi:hypothetical protein